MGAFQRSWDLTKISFSVIGKDKELILFPILAGIFSLLFMAAMILPAFFVSPFLDYQRMQIMGYVYLFLVYLGLAFISTFFNVCVVYTVKKRFENGNSTFFESLAFAASRIHLIFSWSLLSATIGIILRIIENLSRRLGFVGQIIVNIATGIIGMAWSIATIFVVPGMVYNNLGPVEAIKRSVETLKKTWGESLIRYLGFGLVEGLLLVAGIVSGVILVIVSMSFGIIAVGIAILLSVIYILGVIIMFSVATTVFNTALYVYADTGKIPAGFDKEILSNAFQKKEAKI